MKIKILIGSMRYELSESGFAGFKDFQDYGHLLREIVFCRIAVYKGIRAFACEKNKLAVNFFV